MKRAERMSHEQRQKCENLLGTELRESIPRQVGKKSGIPEKERGVWSSQGGEKDKLFVFFYIDLSQSPKTLFSLSPESMITQDNSS